ncbi:MAG TPA: carbamoyltransferase C-terminal domain-containing protein [Steroidobacteraceae bacterium]|nr:carbamoyltransferase C-terminal domain-containing protein [Steroidobacteraceae bacterium]
MLILGWHGHPLLRDTDDSRGFVHHDAAAVLIEDGRIVAAIEEERLNRIKHSNVFPAKAIRFCLKEARATVSDLDAIVTDASEEFHDLLAQRETLSNPVARLPHLRAVVASTFAEEFGCNVESKLQFCKHHVAHLCSAWYPSGFTEALVVSIDGSGDGSSGLIAHCNHQEIKILRHLQAGQSLGDFYTATINCIGYDRFDEYKVMGLAPYGDPKVYAALFSKLYRLLPEGRYTLLPQAERTMLFVEAGLARHARRKGEPFTQDHKDFAAALQTTLEHIVEHVLTHHQKETQSRRLCLSGGVAHNCTMNGVIARSGRFAEIYVQPAAHDAGNALGAALWSLQHSGHRPSAPVLPHLYWGPHIGTDHEIELGLARWKPLVDVSRLSDPAAVAAEMMARGEVIAWVQGRSEFGPRALGNRSILADPRPAENRRIINSMVKKREGYRPFAPAVLEERLDEFFELPRGVERVPYMVLVLKVNAHARELLGAVTHVDGTARVQSVAQRDNPEFHALISAFGQRTGVPVLLNTSFNNDCEPIVDSIDDAIACLLTTGIGALVVGNWLVQKNGDVPAHPAYLDLIPSLRESRKLVRRRALGREPTYSLDSTVSSYFAEPSIAISESMFRLLLESHAQRTARLHAEQLCAEGLPISELTRELHFLWERRALTLTPSTAY